MMIIIVMLTIMLIIMPSQSTTTIISKNNHIDIHNSANINVSKGILDRDNNKSRVENLPIHKNLYNGTTDLMNFTLLNVTAFPHMYNHLFLTTINNTIPNNIWNPKITKQHMPLMQKTLPPELLKPLILPDQEKIEQQQHLHSRSKRYFSFPVGSSFTVAVCFTVGIIGNPRYNYMSFGLNWGVAYNLPNVTWILNRLHDKQHTPLTVWQRRSRRSLYQNIEIILDNMGYHGRECILRALCESRQYFDSSTKFTMMGEMLKAIFSLPKHRVLNRELREQPVIADYDKAYRKTKLTDNCSNKYTCHFSLLDLAFGKYSI